MEEFTSNHSNLLILIDHRHCLSGSSTSSKGHQLTEHMCVVLTNDDKLLFSKAEYVCWRLPSQSIVFTIITKMMLMILDTFIKILLEVHAGM